MFIMEWSAQSLHLNHSELMWELFQKARSEVSSNILTARMPKTCKAITAANRRFFEESKVQRTYCFFYIIFTLFHLKSLFLTLSVTIFSIHFAIFLIQKNVCSQGIKVMSKQTQTFVC